MRIVLMLLLGLGVLPQRAPLEKVQWYKNLDEALEVAKARNVIVFLSFQRDGDKKGKLQLRGTFSNHLFVKRAKEQFVCVIAHRGAVQGEEHQPDQVVDPRSGATVYKCPLYEGITCEHHRTIYRQIKAKYKFKEPPATFLLDPAGEVLVGPKGFPPAAIHAFKKIDEAQKKLEGKSISASRYRKILKSFNKADGQFADEKYMYAISAYRRLEKNRSFTPVLKAQATEALKEINGIGMQLIEKGMKVREEDAEGGLKLLKKVRYEFKGLEAGDKAKKIIDEIKG
ncbi:MAG: hypothetical protein O6952_08655 [Planctomycetota bacterium]|nr:hypothetical protein [Planctomycetota bacterium]